MFIMYNKCYHLKIKYFYHKIIAYLMVIKMITLFNYAFMCSVTVNFMSLSLKFTLKLSLLTFSY